MAQRVIWSKKAVRERKEILNYWNERTKSKSYSKNLNNLFKYSAKLISFYPRIGKPTQLRNIRVKILKDYIMIYEILEKQIHILTVRDARRKPERIDKLIK